MKSKKYMWLIVVVLVVIAVAAFAFKSGPPAPVVGTAAPDFTLSSQDGKPVSLHDYRGKWVVLYFYPKDFTSGCTLEAHNFQRDLPQYEKQNAVILGVSVQSIDSHKQFCSKEGLSFKLLADTNHEVTASYGSVLNLGIAKLSARHTFLIDPQGVIVKEYQAVSPSKHSQEVLTELAQLQQSKS
jgi:peroxiredoxin Q/BCP